MENPVTNTTNNTSHNNSNVTIATSNSTTRIVRIHWLKFLFYSWKRISALSKLVVVSSIFLVIAQVATGISILATSADESCDQPLQAYIIVYVVRVIISGPFYVAQHFGRAEQRLRSQRQQERDGRREDQVRTRRHQRRQRARAEHSSNQVTGVTSSSSSMAQQEPAVIPSNASTHSTVIEPRSNWMTFWGDRLRSLMDLFAILWFIVGNYLLFTTQTCSRDAPKLFYTSLAYILIGYFVVIIPLILCTSVIFCLPCVLIIMRVLHISEMEGMVNQGGRAEEIRKIRVYRYKVTSASDINDNSSAQEPSVISTTTQQSLTHKENGFVSKLLRFKHRQHAIEPEEGLGSYDDIFITPIEDALCCICLSEYENNDLLCKLWCNHHFHKSCITEWLTLNRKCPLCKQDFRGKEYEDDSEDTDDEDNVDDDDGVEDETNGERRQIQERVAADEISMARLSNNNTNNAH